MERSDDLVPVTVLRIPVAIHARSTEHMDALQREFELIRLSDSDSSSVPHILNEMLTQLEEEFGGLSDEPRAEMNRAMERGLPYVDINYFLPAAAADASKRLDDLLDQVDEYCRQGEHLLTLASTPEAVAFRKWFLGEMIAQIGGAAPTPWSDDLCRTGPSSAENGDGAEVQVGAPVTLPDGWTVVGDVEQPTLSISDDLDLHSAPILREAIAQLLRSGGRHVTVDLSQTPFVDSVGLSVLVSAHARLNDSGAALSLIAPSNVRRVMTLAGLDGILHVQPAE